MRIRLPYRDPYDETHYCPECGEYYYSGQFYEEDPRCSWCREEANIALCEHIKRAARDSSRETAQKNKGKISE